ncbi:hypothetical protein GCM10012280_56730 [Wenjunlia tyrosinilytica]|uniref:Uncharacterized protein n=1 Tax=Wenjunlia tyrosinilytica TaxID=1544741 RepID=A0A918E150_9ACTN|nr:hypothetical protein GCM10012280_56730 [Wenjunlia tyrosinilytica]
MEHAGVVTSVRNPRTPSAGFGSSAGVRKSSGLSAPASSARTTTRTSGNVSDTFRYAATWRSSDGACPPSSRREEHGAEQADALGSRHDGGGHVRRATPTFDGSGARCPSAVAPGPEAEARAAAWAAI